MTIYIELGTLLVALFLLYLTIKFVKDPLAIIANSILGIIIFLILDTYLGFGIPLNIFSVAVVAIAGGGGLILVILFHFLGWG